MALLTTQVLSRSGIVPSFAAAAAGGDTFACGNDMRDYVEVKNASGASITVTVAAVQTSLNTGIAGTVTIPNISVAVAAGAQRKIGPFPAAYINNGIVSMTYSAVTSVTVGAFRTPNE